MDGTVDTDKELDELNATLCRLANEHAESDEVQRILRMTWTQKRAQRNIIERNYFMHNRRDCWGFVQSKAPLDVKKLTWEHEEEELMGNAEEGKADHIAMNIAEGEVLGLTAEEFYATPASDGTATCMLAWRQIASESPWLEALAASCALELSNSDEILENGAMSRRTAEKIKRDLGIPVEKQVSSAEHIEADIEHANLLMQVARVHGRTPEAREQILSGVRKSWQVDSVYKNELGYLLERITE